MAYKNQLQYITAMRFFAIQLFSEGEFLWSFIFQLHGSSFYLNQITVAPGSRGGVEIGFKTYKNSKNPSKNGPLNFPIFLNKSITVFIIK